MLFLMMIASVMFFGTEGTEFRPMGTTVGPFSITLSQFFIALFSILMVTPSTILMVTLFKRAKPRSKDFNKTLNAGSHNAVKPNTCGSWFLCTPCCKSKNKNNVGMDKKVRIVFLLTSSKCKCKK